MTAGPGSADATMSVARANAIALLWLPVSAVLAAAPFLLVWGYQRLAAAPPRLPPVLAGLALMAALVLVHELLHAAGFLLIARAPRAQVRVGFQRRTLTPYACCRIPMTAASYRAAALLPALVLGGLPVLAAWAVGSATLLLWGWFMLALAGGDVAAVWAMRRVPGGALVEDDQARVGCRVLGPISAGG